MSKNLCILLILMLFISLGLRVGINPVSGGSTVVKVDPSLIEYHANATGQQFTVAVKIVDVTNLYGFDLKFRWNTTFLSYVNRSVYVPRNASSPDGVLWGSTSDGSLLKVMDAVNTTAGTYWIAYASMYPAPSFNGTGTVFNMTFSVIYHPGQPPDANITLELYSTDLSNPIGNPIPHTTQDGTVILYALAASHDVAATGISPLNTIIGQGYSGKINVTVANQGDFAETFNVTVYANQTIIAPFVSVTLISGDMKTLMFIWNTTSFGKGNYTMSVYAGPVLGDMNTTNNTFYDGVVKVTIPGDLNGDFKVSLSDLAILAKAYGSAPGDAKWNPNADINGNGAVSLSDLSIMAKYYGQHYP